MHVEPFPARREDTMMRYHPYAWTALNVALASAATYIVCSSDLLLDAAVFLLR
jgi:hypothetical protein